LLEANGGVFLEIRPGREHVGAQEADVAVGGFVQKKRVGRIAIRTGQVVLGGDCEAGHDRQEEMHLQLGGFRCPRQCPPYFG
jgi:hypothetical protein